MNPRPRPPYGAAIAVLLLSALPGQIPAEATAEATAEACFTRKYVSASPGPEVFPVPVLPGATPGEVTVTYTTSDGYPGRRNTTQLSERVRFTAVPSGAVHVTPDVPDPTDRDDSTVSGSAVFPAGTTQVRAEHATDRRTPDSVTVRFCLRAAEPLPPATVPPSTEPAPVPDPPPETVPAPAPLPPAAPPAPVPAAPTFTG